MHLPVPTLNLGPFGTLNQDRPLLMLPVRLETVFHGPPGNPDSLHIRIFPDVCHADALSEDLSQREIDLASAMWETYFRGGEEGRQGAFDWLAQIVGPWRAAWIANVMLPSNVDSAPTVPTPEGQPLPVSPDLPPIGAGESQMATIARLLPDYWVAIGYNSAQPLFEVSSQPVQPDLVMAPNVAADIDPSLASDASAWLSDQGLDWTKDFDSAYNAGMAICVPLNTLPTVAQGLDDLVVIGVRQGDQSSELSQLLRAHQFTRGLGLPRDGTPTNNTSSLRSGSSASRPSRSDLLQLALKAPLPTFDPHGVLGAGPPETMLTMETRNVVELALGLDGSSPIQRVAGGDEARGLLARAMVEALWPVTWGYFFDTAFSGLLSDTTPLREWFTNWVVGGSPLGTLQIGPQPYGLLTHVSLQTYTGANPPVGFDQEMENALAWMRFLDWIGALQHVPVLDPNAPSTDIFGETTEGATVRLAQVLGAVPNPTNFRLRGADEQQQSILGTYNALSASAMADMNAGDAGYIATDVTNKLPLDDSVGWEIFVWEQANMRLGGHRAGLSDPIKIAAVDSARTTISSDILPHLERHDLRTKAPQHFPPITLFDSSITATGPEISFSEYLQEEEPWERPLVSADGDVSVLQGWLGDLALGALPSPPPAGAPLLYQLLAHAVAESPTPEVFDALSLLAGNVSALADPIGDLERLMRETLGLATHRLDAWFQGVALERLAWFRYHKDPVGINVGAYGWVVNLRPRASLPTSDGYVLAPSLNHAATAAILRSGWRSFGGVGDAATVAVNLESERVRRGRWILEGVRRGQHLPELLGMRFERSLHDESLDPWLDDIRQAVLDAQSDDRQPVEIVDGLILARAMSDLPTQELTTEEAAARVELQNLVAGVQPVSDRDKLQDLLDALAGDFDACGDVLLAQAVHALVGGSVDAAQASASALGSGDGPIPPVDMPKTPRGSRVIGHRVVVPFTPASMPAPPVTWPGTTTSPFRHDAAHLESWLSSLLPDPTDVQAQISFKWDDGSPTEVFLVVSLSDLGLSALDAVYMASRGPSVAGSDLARWAVTYARENPPTAPPAPPADATVEIDTTRFFGIGDPVASFEEWGLAARPMAELLQSSRPMTAADLSSTAALGSDTDMNAIAPGAPLAAEAELEQRVDDLADALTNELDPVPAMKALALHGIQGAIPEQLHDDTALLRQAEELLIRAEEMRARIVTLRDQEITAWSAMDATRRRRSLIDRVRHSVGHQFPPAGTGGTFRPDNATTLEQTFGHSALRNPVPSAVESWLRKNAMVRGPLAKLVELHDALDLLADGSVAGLSTAQLPFDPGDTWWAETVPPPDRRGEWLHLVRWSVAGTLFDEGGGTGAETTGFVVDSWSDSVPDPTQDTALAVHFDAPSSRAPNAMLLLVPDEAAGWSYTRIRDAVKSTLDGARYRAVGPEHEERWGHQLPAIFLPSTASASEGP